MDKFFVGFGSRKNEYVINGIRYCVTSKFMPVKNNPTLTDKVGHFLNSDFADLTGTDNMDRLNTDYVCSTVRKEDK